MFQQGTGHLENIINVCVCVKILNSPYSHSNIMDMTSTMTSRCTENIDPEAELCTELKWF